MTRQELRQSVRQSQHSRSPGEGRSRPQGAQMSRKSLFPILMGAGAGLLFMGSKARHRRSLAAERGHSRQAADEATRRYLMYIIMPVWSVAGFLDWLWHRQTKIETTSGVKESIMHLLMMAEA